MNKLRLQAVVLTGLIIVAVSGCGRQSSSNSDSFDPRVEPLLEKMTLEEKLGQLNQLSNPYVSTGAGESQTNAAAFDDMIKEGKVGSFLNVTGAAETKRLQKIAVEESRLGIPLIFGYDVIHGFKTMFPIPLAEAASFDMQAIEKSSAVAAVESAANGIHWTFAPMVDICRDPRWGRIMEGSGEDVFLGCRSAEARVKGFQGNDLAAPNTIAACVKHFAAYGAPIGGRDYNAVDMSERMLRQTYLPPYKAAVDAGVATVMSSFNTINSVHASTDRQLQTEILKNEWNFKGFVVSDWASVAEAIPHGVAATPYDAAFEGLNAGVDMDMMGNLYLTYGKQLIEEKKIAMSQIDDMVRRILNVKFKLGLFDSPYQYCDEEAEKANTMNAGQLSAARDVAKRTLVLLKNDNNLLPLPKNGKRIAVIGPLANDKDAPLGNWRASAIPGSAVSLLEGIQAAVAPETKVVYAEGCPLTTNYPHTFFTPVQINTSDRSGFANAVNIARQSDVVVVALGEVAMMSGECRSYADISLKGLQAELLKELRKTGKPIVLTLFTGRPLVLTDVVDDADAILNCWLPGSQSGYAVADVLFGDYNPAGRLPVSFPWHVGQIPVSYENLNTGRPNLSRPGDFSSEYRDVPNAPLFAFGYGLSYTTFSYSDLKLDKTTLTMSDSVTITATVTNTGSRDGEEVVQLYVRDLVGNGVARPTLQMKGFQKVMVGKDNSLTVSFTLNPQDLAFLRADGTWAPEAGQFEVYVGPASNNLPLRGKFELAE